MPEGHRGIRGGLRLHLENLYITRKATKSQLSVRAADLPTKGGVGKSVLEQQK